jgi:hypothetical protein
VSDKGELEERMSLDLPGDELCAVGGRRKEGKRGWESMMIPLLSLYRIQWPYVPCIYVHSATNIIGQKKRE